jgi:hypothetical protein
MICKCGYQLMPKQARCGRCGKQYDHRFWYPEQYDHPLVGKRVRVCQYVEGDPIARGVVTRVVSSRFGQLAHLDTSGDTAYAVRQCVPE